MCRAGLKPLPGAARLTEPGQRSPSSPLCLSPNPELLEERRRGHREPSRAELSQPGLQRAPAARAGGGPRPGSTGPRPAALPAPRCTQGGEGGAASAVRPARPSAACRHGEEGETGEEGEGG